MFLLFILFSTVFAEQYCPNLPAAQISCINHPIVYIFDETIFFGVDGFKSEMDFFYNRIIPIMDFGVGENVNKVLADFAGYHQITKVDDVCYALNQLEAQYNNHINSYSSDNNLLTMVKWSMMLAQSMNSFGSDKTTIVLFASTQSQSEIQQAATYVIKNSQGENFLVVAMRNADFSSFPASMVYNISDLYYTPPCFAYTLQQNACGDFEACQSCPCPVQPITTSTSSRKPITSSTSTTLTTKKPTVSTPTTLPSSGTTPIFSPNYSFLNPACQCQWNMSYNDVVFLFDGSRSTTAQGLADLWASAQSWLPFFNIQKHGYSQTKHYMQVGIIVYSSVPHVVSALGEWDGDQIDTLEQLPYYGDVQTDIGGAIQAAWNQLTGPNGRSTSRKIIIIMATSYDEQGQDAEQQADGVKEDGGIIMTFNYIETHGDASPQLCHLSSPGYCFVNLNTSLYDLCDAQCDANCRCSPDTEPFSKSVRGYPIGGCYNFIRIQSNFVKSQARCSQFQSYLAVDESAEKTAFLQKNIQNDFWVGLTFNSTINQWQWINGFPLNGSYAPWYNGNVPSGKDGNTRVYSHNGTWVSTDQRNGYFYSCEIQPCDSLNFCS